MNAFKGQRLLGKHLVHIEDTSPNMEVDSRHVEGKTFKLQTKIIIQTANVGFKTKRPLFFFNESSLA